MSVAARQAVAALLPVLLAACGGGGGDAPPATVITCPAGSEAVAGGCRPLGPAVHVVVTLVDQSRLLASDPDLHFSAVTTPAATNIDVDPATRYQSMVGVGGALTDSSAWLIQNRLSATQRTNLLADLFGTTGAGLGFLRFTIGASDFSLSMYTLDDLPAGQADYALAHFSAAPLQADVVPTLQAIRALQPTVALVASPWSAPAWMKTNTSLVHSPDPAVTGTLLPAAYDAWAEYLVRTVEALQAAGLPLHAITMQNEPAYEPADYPGMILAPATRAQLVAQNLGPKLQLRAPAVRLLEWDHNWDAPAQPLAVLGDAAARPFISGVAWHCYAGDPGAQGPVHDAFPDKEAYITECSGGAWAPVWKDNFDWIVGTLLVNGTRNWARGVLLWNLALDEASGPHTGGCGNCRGIVTINPATGAVTRNEEYYALAHYGRFVRSGAQRIDSSAAANGVSSVAFRNPDDGSVALLVLNGASAARSFTIRQGGKVAAYALPAGAVATFSWLPAP